MTKLRNVLLAKDFGIENTTATLRVFKLVSRNYCRNVVKVNMDLYSALS